ncbi:MAG: Crp/Fnr family transcriptional regulator [Azoarcus sp.]|jgi:CRP-like cAMP-binding protein|nr:Crp/Fnr family transcriptional regulator [Azoarcus sp.]
MTKESPIDLKVQLANRPLFSGFSPEEIARITQGARELQVKKGTVLFNKGDECKGMHLLLYGLVKLSFTSSQGQEKVVEIIQPNQTFGEAVMFMERPHVVTAQTLVDSWILFFPKVVMFNELDRDPKLARKMIASLSVRMHQLINDIGDYSLHSGKKRIISFLLREIPENVLNGGDNAFTVTLAMNKNTLASRLSMTQEHLSRILHELAELGLITVHGREIAIPNIRRLQQSED